MTAVELDRDRFPNLTGIERPFLDFWSEHILRPDDPHRERWIEYEEDAVERAAARTEVISGVRDVEGQRVLDVGCQNGAWLIALARAGAVRPAGIDVDVLGVEAAKVRAAAYGVEVDARVASASEMPFATGEFDIVASSDVLEHVPDKVAMIHECVRVLKPGGLLCLSAPVRFSVKHLRSDPHYHHRGVSILPGNVARWWLTTFRGEQEYEVETLPTRRWTERELRRRGMELLDPQGRPLPAPSMAGVARSVVDELRQGFTILARKPLD